MKPAIAAIVALLGIMNPAHAQESQPRWDCFCERRPCQCTPLPPSNPQLCDIQCPRNTRFVDNCSCEPVTGPLPSEEDVRRKRLEEERTKRR